MPKVERKVAKKIGLISAISMLIGSTIGVGIFFKNNNVFLTNDYNSIAILIAWIISGIISICTAFCFAEVGSAKQSHSGLGGWYEKIIGSRSGQFIKIIQPFFYFVIIAFAIAIFTGEAVFNIFDYSSEINFGIIMLVGFSLFIFFLVFNLISISISAKFQIVVTGLKFIPLLMIIFAGIIFGAMHGDNNMFINNHVNAINGNNELDFVGIIISIPAILFAFDSFVGVGNLSLDMKKPQKNVPLAIIIGMVIVTIFYILITIAQIMVGQGNIYDVFNLIFADNQVAREAITIILSIFVLVSIIGVLNAFSLIVIKSCQSLYDERLIFFHEKIGYLTSYINNRFQYRQGFLIAICYVIIIFIITLIPSTILNTDAFIDGLSNFPTTIFFSFYATIILATLINRFTKKIPVIKIKFFVPMAIISIIGCYFVTGFQIFYTFFAKTIIDPNQTLAWGLFSTNGYIVYNWMGTILMFSFFVAGAIYYLSTIWYLKKNKTSKNERFIWKEAYD